MILLDRPVTRGRNKCRMNGCGGEGVCRLGLVGLVAEQPADHFSSAKSAISKGTEPDTYHVISSV